jgi:uncharacterized pyridoxamine 5'-phosphate oxidase family protein
MFIPGDRVKCIDADSPLVNEEIYLVENIEFSFYKGKEMVCISGKYWFADRFVLSQRQLRKSHILTNVFK